MAYPGIGETDRSPLLVTGLPRSGTSWVGKMLQLSGQAVYVNEPMNPHHRPGRSPGVLDAKVDYAYQYICPENEAPWLRAFRDTVRLRYHVTAELRTNRAVSDLARMGRTVAAFSRGRVKHLRALVDDPYAVLSSRWFAERLGARTVVLVREPVSWVASWERLGWTHYFHNLLEQPLLMRDYLDRFADELRAAIGSADSLAKNALLWKVTYATIAQMHRESGLLHLVRYEDLASDPVEGFRQLYDVCGLDYTDDVARKIAAATTARTESGGAMAWTLRGGLSKTAYRPMDSRAALARSRTYLCPEAAARVEEITADSVAQLDGLVYQPAWPLRRGVTAKQFDVSRP